MSEGNCDAVVGHQSVRKLNLCAQLIVAPGERCITHSSLNRGIRWNAIVAMNCYGVVAYTIYTGSTNGERYQELSASAYCLLRIPTQEGTA